MKFIKWEKQLEDYQIKKELIKLLTITKGERKKLRNYNGTDVQKTTDPVSNPRTVTKA